MSASTERHETRALLRAHLAAASGYRHLTRNCPICYRLLRLAMEPLTAPQTPYAPREPRATDGAPPDPETAAGASGEDHKAAHGPLRPSAEAGEGPTDRPRDHAEGILRDQPKDESPPAA
ncbi:DUF6274 family protein [Streptomyces sp. NPDC002908]|uniref:DUF6274 family protein n=1 Tax=Streptomyces sp. NPDC002908 TaxID=3364670 RepID=UPI003679113C